MPTLSSLLDWVQREGINAVWIVMVGFALKYLFEQKWSKFIIFLLAAGATAFVVNNPRVVSQAFEAVSNLFFR
jgi:ABC-type iron transport system FetAB permease component